MRLLLTYILFSFLFYANILGQSQRKTIDEKENVKILLDSLSTTISPLNYRINISVSDVSLREFLRGVANSAGLNLYIDPTLNEKIANSFSNVRVADVLVFLLEQYHLELEVTGNILYIFRRKNHISNPQKVIYDSTNKTLSLNVNDEKLKNVVQEIVDATNENIILAPGIEKRNINLYLRSMPIEDAIKSLAFSNQLSFKIDSTGIIKLFPETSTTHKAQTIQIKNKEPIKYQMNINVLPDSNLNVVAINAPIEEIIKQASSKLSINYILTSGIEGITTITTKKVTFDKLLSLILEGTEYTYKNKNEYFIIGDKKQNILKDWRVIKLKYRTVDTVQSLIPENLLENVDIETFIEQNSILISGSVSQLEEIEKFIKKIDKLVPVISIEVLIIDVNKSFNITTGIEAGLGEAPVKTKGTILPGVDLTIGANAINRLIEGFNGFGWVNLGKVQKNFYISLKAMEQQGLLKIRSTPLLSTLNGHKASLEIGNQEYYIEETTNLIGTQNPTQTTVRTFKPVNVEMALSILPIVSGDNQITLQIDVIQSDFTERISKYAPPGNVSRKFHSLIRVKNGDMILLGGLEEKRTKENSTGVPWLSRIPILKWIFSSRNKTNEESKLNIFIKPRIIN